MRLWILLPVAILLLGMVVAFGWYQFSRRAGRPISMVRDLETRGYARTVGKRIDEFLKEKGVEVAQAFEPRWGAEELRNKEGECFVVSYTYEEGRTAESISWEVDLRTKEIHPRDAWAKELISPRGGSR